jgi:hypothetical protein
MNNGNPNGAKLGQEKICKDYLVMMLDERNMKTE